MSRPAGVERSRPSRSETRPTLRSCRSWKRAVNPLAVLPSRSSRQQTTVDTFPCRMAASSFRQPGRSIVLPVNLSLYHLTGLSWASAQRFRSGFWLAVSWLRKTPGDRRQCVWRSA